MPRAQCVRCAQTRARALPLPPHPLECVVGAWPAKRVACGEPAVVQLEQAGAGRLHECTIWGEGEGEGEGGGTGSGRAPRSGAACHAGATHSTRRGRRGRSLLLLPATRLRLRLHAAPCETSTSAVSSAAVSSAAIHWIISASMWLVGSGRASGRPGQAGGGMQTGAADARISSRPHSHRHADTRTLVQPWSRPGPHHPAPAGLASPAALPPVPGGAAGRQTAATLCCPGRPAPPPPAAAAPRCRPGRAGRAGGRAGGPASSAAERQRTRACTHLHRPPAALTRLPRVVRVHAFNG